MWRLFPYSEECLTPLLCFSCVTPALHMCSLDETLAVAFQDRETVTYRIVYYNLMDQMRMEHGPEDDPLDDITGVHRCPSTPAAERLGEEGGYLGSMNRGAEGGGRESIGLACRRRKC